MTNASIDLRSVGPSGRRSPHGLLLLGLALPALLVCVMVGGLASVITTIPTLLVLLLLYRAVVAWAVSTEPDPRLKKLIRIGFVVKLFGFVVRYLVITQAYAAGDAKDYHASGAFLAQSFRQGNFGTSVPGRIGGAGTQAVRVITGVIYTATGPSLLVGALVFSLLSFTGVLLFVKAFRLTVPNGDHLRYHRLLLFLPSMWFWPSSLGKDAWMLFTLGVLAYGAARLYRRIPGGLVLVALGAAGSAYVRPHIVLVVGAAAAVALVLRSGGQDRRRFNRIGKVLILVPMILGGLVLVSKAQSLLKVDDLSPASIAAVGKQAGEQSAEGGSAFNAVPVTSIQKLPVAAVTVLFRPFPFEAHNALSLVISLEGTFLLLLTVSSWRRVLVGLRGLRRTPYLVMCLIASLGFVVAFSHLANFGILARERVQMLPFTLALLAATAGRRAPDEPEADTKDSEEPPAPASTKRQEYMLRWRAPDAAAT